MPCAAVLTVITLALAGYGAAQIEGGAGFKSRLLNQLAAPTGSIDLGDGSFITRQAARVNQTAAQHPVQVWVLVGAGLLCVVLLGVLAAQWAAELAAWRRRARQLEQDEACRTHLEGLQELDLESPSKSKAESTPGWAYATPGASPPPSPPRQLPLPAAPPQLRLPGSTLIRRTPSLRSEVLSRAVGSPRVGACKATSPKSPLGLSASCAGHNRSAAVSRTASGLSSPGDAAPRSPTAADLTVDPSVKAGDIEATGWAVNPHAAAARSTSLAAPDDSSYTFTPRLEYRLPPRIAAVAAELPAGEVPGAEPAADEEAEPASRTDSASASCNTDSPTDRGSSGALPQAGAPGKAPRSGRKELVRAATEGTLVDFRLGTQVTDASEGEAGDAGGEAESDVRRQRRTTSSERAPGKLQTARSIKPLRALVEEEGAAGAGAAAALAPPAQQASRAAAPLETLSGVPLLSPEQFESEVALVRVLGAGGAGSVHEAVWRGRAVAVKVLHPSRQASVNAVLSFRREVDLMSRIGPHPNVVSVLGACLEPPTMSIIQDLAERGSLHAALHDEGLRPQYGALLQLAEDVASAMAHCHALVPPLVHRDLKSHNVLLDAQGRARVADFGLAAAKHRTFLTVERGALGTACIMAPEQFAAGQVDERCDSYAFGCLLWECITGRQPWEECSNIMQIVMAVGCEKRRPAMPAGCPPQLARLIRECWRHSASLRPGFAEILERIKAMREPAAAAGADSIDGSGPVRTGGRPLSCGPYRVFNPSKLRGAYGQTRLGSSGGEGAVELSVRRLEANAG